MRGLALLLFVLLWAPQTWAAGGTESVAAIRAAVLAILDEGAEFTLDPALKMPRCASPLQAIRSGSNTVEVSCTGPSSWRLFVPVRIRRHAQVLVLNRGIAAGEAIRADMFTLETRDTSRMVGAPLSDPASAIGQIARRALAAGSVLASAHLRAPDAVRRGDQVTLISRQGGLEVRMAGRALNAGGIGERISAENLSSRRRVQGVVVADGDVLIQP